MVSIKWEHQLYFYNTFYTNKKGKQKNTGFEFKL